jgi:TPP-dependent 2-oxoacid decarboxylase
VDRVIRAIWMNRRPGYIEIHRDMVDQIIPVPKTIRNWDGNLPNRQSDHRRVIEAARETAARFNRAKRPLLIGIEVHRYKLMREIVELAERTGAPVTTTVLGKGAFPMDHPLHMGVHVGTISPPKIRKRVDDADLVINLGTLLTDMNLGSQPPQITRDKSSGP